MIVDHLGLDWPRVPRWSRETDDHFAARVRAEEQAKRAHTVPDAQSPPAVIAAEAKRERRRLRNLAAR